MRGKLLAAAIAVAASAPVLLPVSAKAQEGAFCAEQGGRNGYRNCGYYNYAQCRAAVSGVGGFCYSNPRGQVGDPRYGYGGYGDYGGGYGAYGYQPGIGVYPPPAPRGYYYRPY